MILAKGITSAYRPPDRAAVVQFIILYAGGTVNFAVREQSAVFADEGSLV